MSLHVRIATREDKNSIVDFNKHFAKTIMQIDLSDAKANAGVNHVFNSLTSGIYLVAELNKKIIGLCMLTKEFSDWEDGVFYAVQGIYALSDEDAVTSMLIDKIKSIAKNDEEICGIRYYVSKDNNGEYFKHLQKEPYVIYHEIFKESK